jgi:hypothetical protein
VGKDGGSIRQYSSPSWDRPFAFPRSNPLSAPPSGSAYLPHNTQRCGQPSSVVLARLDRPEADFYATSG